MQSKWFDINQAVATHLQAYVGSLGHTFLENPALPLDLGMQGGTRFDRAVFLIARGDRLQDQPGQNPERRVARFVVGAVALTATALAHADELHFGARDALKSSAFRQALIAVGDVKQLREVELEPELKEATAAGSVLMSAYEVEYFQAYPSFA